MKWVVRLFSNWKSKKKKVKKLVDLSGNWYLEASAVFVSQRELDIQLLNKVKEQPDILES
tara:strand:+ start:3028 stop:3207 length:180 start_codon:yes stop_codon:yes gene_type:complete